MSTRATNEAPGTQPLDAVRDTFAALTAPPDPLSIDGTSVPGFPDRAVPLDEARKLLFAKDCLAETSDAVWRLAVHRSQSGSAEWTMACAGLALPGLARLVRQLGAWYRGDLADIAATVLAGFLEALAAVDPDRDDAISERLRRAAQRAGHAAVAQSLKDPLPLELEEPDEVIEAILTGFRSVIPKPPWGHPDLVLARAVADGVLTPTEAELIGVTRLEEVTIADWARARRVKLKTAYSARRRAEARLAEYLTDAVRDADPGDETEPAVSSAVALTRPATNPTPAPGQSRAVSGRHRNGRAGLQSAMSRSVKNFGSKSGLFRCRGLAPEARPTSADPDWEDGRCA